MQTFSEGQCSEIRAKRLITLQRAAMLQAADPNLDFKTQIRSQDGKIKVRAVKCSCKKAGCPRCGLRTSIKRFADRVKRWNYRYVRQVVLTVDHELYKDSEDAITTIRKKSILRP